MSSRYLLSPAAHADLEQIWDYRLTPDDVVDVVRVLYQRMDVDRHL